MSAGGARLVAEGPWFEELRQGQVFDRAPAVTLTDGLAAVHQAVVGGRLRLALDHDLSRRVTGEAQPLAPPALVWDVAIGSSTTVTHHVVANLFYRGLVLRRAPVLGDTLRTRTEVVALRQNTVRPGRRPTGLAALRITTVDQQERLVLDFWRCAMLPLRDPDVVTGHADDLDQVGSDAVEPGTSGAGAGPTAAWRLDAFRDAVPADGQVEVRAGDVWEVAGGDVVSSAPELARLTTNVARTHHDDAAGTDGRLVYGGHTIGIALTQVLRALPDLVTVVGWRSCEHLGPVHEGDTLTSTVEVEDVSPLPDGRLVQLRSRVAGRSQPGGAEHPVLDWRFAAVLA
jgi:acyl dehydratase